MQEELTFTAGRCTALTVLAVRMKLSCSLVQHQQLLRAGRATRVDQQRRLASCCPPLCLCAGEPGTQRGLVDRNVHVSMHADVLSMHLNQGLDRAVHISLGCGACPVAAGRSMGWDNGGTDGLDLKWLCASPSSSFGCASRSSGRGLLGRGRRPARLGSAARWVACLPLRRRRPADREHACAARCWIPAKQSCRRCRRPRR